MADIQTEEGWFTISGAKLYTKTWKASTPKAILVFIHGFSDHCNAYYDLFPSLARRGIQTYSFDQRGWGRSVHAPRDKGNSGGTTRILADISAFIKALPPSPLPTFLMGHSMGGGEVLTYAALGPADIRAGLRGYLVESPFIAFPAASKPSFITLKLGQLAGKILPHFQIERKFPGASMCRDPEVGREWEADPLCHNIGTLEGLGAMVDRAEELDSGKISIGGGAGEGEKTRLWVGHGTGDLVCDYKGSERLVERLSKSAADVTLKLYDGWYHKLHAEPGEDKVTFANDVGNWILAHAGESVAVKL
ncbi:lysophospholipase-like protein [Trichodelitschia bisporula]|uniref:Lysophospholipase-like protein n=1 Tax=Trichodelitschia bisporula TaxID=703511 RepID=A0A6G1HU86_9PEZI|nr:lysophospholipase-like protein [Trichodelitschia bisporula]